jgi:hypothetical protein
MLQFWGTLLVVMVVAAAILFPISMWFGEMLTHEPSYFRRWILGRLFIGVRDPQIAVASSLGAVVSVAATSPPTTATFNISQIGGSEIELGLEIVGVIRGASFPPPSVASATPAVTVRVQ